MYLIWFNLKFFLNFLFSIGATYVTQQELIKREQFEYGRTNLYQGVLHCKLTEVRLRPFQTLAIIGLRLITHHWINSFSLE